MGIVDFIFPRVCVGCAKEGQYICDRCRVKMLKPVAICPMCSKPSLDGWTHARCKTPNGLDRLIIGLPYKGMVQDCLKKVKYKSAWDVIEFLYKQCDFGDLESSLITFVPMWEGKQRGRGFNQAEMIAKLMSAERKVPYLTLLQRTRETKPQYGLNKEQRISNIEGAFRMKMHESLLNLRRIILVDDVWTTGATMRECAKALKRNGVREIWGVTLAR